MGTVYAENNLTSNRTSYLNIPYRLTKLLCLHCIVGLHGQRIQIALSIHRMILEIKYFKNQGLSLEGKCHPNPIIQSNPTISLSDLC